MEKWRYWWKPLLTINEHSMKTIYIEGESDTDNGSLREAFSRLLEQELHGNMPRVIMGDGKNQAIDKFHSTPIKPNEERFLLFDSDEAAPNKRIICDAFNATKPNRKIDATEDNTFLMIQEVEAWILSQPNVLQKLGIKIKASSYPNVEEVNKPSEELGKLYKKVGKTYTKVKEFVKVFPLLDSATLRKSCPEYNNLINALKA